MTQSTQVRGIPQQEFQERIARAKELMTARNLEALFVFGNETECQNVRYLSNYWSLFESAAVLLHVESEPLLLIGPESLTYARSRSVIPNIRRLLLLRESSEPDYPGTELDSFRSVFDEVSDGRGIGRLGMVGLSYTPYPVYRAIEESVGTGEMVDGSEILSSMRMIKSENELSIMRAASKISEQGLRTVIEKIRPGMTELQVVGIALQSMYDVGMEREAHPVYVLSGANSTHAVGRASHKALEEGEIVQLGIPAMIHGYCASVQRPVVLGHLDRRIRDFLEVGLERENLAISLMTEGREIKEVAIKTNEFLKKKGYERYFLYGPAHGIGLGENEYPFVEENSTGVLSKNMTFNICAYLGDDTIGQRWEDGVRITAGGGPPEEFSSYQREITIIK
jgi:Xaa-Pro aminopeptidase